MPKLTLEKDSFIVTTEIEGDEGKISLEEYFLIEAEMKQLLQDLQMFDWKERCRTDDRCLICPGVHR